MDTKQDNKKAAIIISAILILLAGISLLYLLQTGLGGTEAGSGYIAEIYQNGRLLYSIPLNDLSQTQILVIESTEGGINEVEVRPGSIGIISADCPDKICVQQGFITDAKLPITCLPNRLVILLRPVPKEAEQNSITPDTITY